MTNQNTNSKSIVFGGQSFDAPEGATHVDLDSGFFVPVEFFDGSAQLEPTPDDAPTLMDIMRGALDKKD